MKPHTCFLVCTSHRSGSGMLCDSLWQTNLAGRPDEYFSLNVEKEYSNKWGTRTYSQYLDRVIENGTSPNGIFGAKIMWRQTHFLRQKVSKFLNCANLDTQVLLSRIFPGLKYIWLKRRDKVRQAVSLWMRRQTGLSRWFEETQPRYKNQPEFNFLEIYRLVNQFGKWDACWSGYFRKYRLKPFIVVYEDDLEHGREDVIRHILNRLGVKIPDGLNIQTKYKRQSNELSEKFVHLYKEELKLKLSK